jgi:hypothetical protein
VKKDKAMKEMEDKRKKQTLDGREGLPTADQYLHMIPPIANSLKPVVFKRMQERAEKDKYEIARH